jgi:hypothetical protein
LHDLAVVRGVSVITPANCSVATVGWLSRLSARASPSMKPVRLKVMDWSVPNAGSDFGTPR